MGLGAAGALSAASRRGSASAPDAIRIGIVGGGRGDAVLVHEVLHSGRAVRITDVCGLQGAQPPGAYGHASWESLVERGDVDGVVVATPPDRRVATAVAAMVAGWDVYCASPATTSVAEALRLRDAAARTGRVVQVGSKGTSEGPWHEARRLVRSGAIGGLRWCQDGARGLGHDAIVEALFDRLATVIMATGERFPTSVSAMGGVGGDQGGLTMTARYAGGHSVVIAVGGRGVGSGQPILRGSDAFIEVGKDTVIVGPEMGFRGSGKVAGVRAEFQVPVRASHMANWLDCMRTREKPVCDEELSYRATVAVAMALQSARTGRTTFFDVATGQIT